LFLIGAHPPKNCHPADMKDFNNHFALGACEFFRDIGSYFPRRLATVDSAATVTHQPLSSNDAA
jgi:hypothetical protein